MINEKVYEQIGQYNILINEIIEILFKNNLIGKTNLCTHGLSILFDYEFLLGTDILLNKIFYDIPISYFLKSSDYFIDRSKSNHDFYNFYNYSIIHKKRRDSILFIIINKKNFYNLSEILIGNESKIKETITIGF